MIPCKTLWNDTELVEYYFQVLLEGNNLNIATLLQQLYYFPHTTNFTALLLC